MTSVMIVRRHMTRMFASAVVDIDLICSQQQLIVNATLTTLDFTAHSVLLVN